MHQGSGMGFSFVAVFVFGLGGRFAVRCAKPSRRG